jgi:protein tyrosine phosphatase type 4A
MLHMTGFASINASFLFSRRAPVMVALALMELGMSYEEAVDLIRSKRKGAINTKQLEFLEKYRPKNRLKSKNSNKCTIS